MRYSGDRATAAFLNNAAVRTRDLSYHAVHVLVPSLVPMISLTLHHVYLCYNTNAVLNLFPWRSVPKVKREVSWSTHVSAYNEPPQMSCCDPLRCDLNGCFSPCFTLILQFELRVPEKNWSATNDYDLHVLAVSGRWGCKKEGQYVCIIRLSNGYMSQAQLVFKTKKFNQSQSRLTCLQ